MLLQVRAQIIPIPVIRVIFRSNTTELPTKPAQMLTVIAIGMDSTDNGRYWQYSRWSTERIYRHLTKTMRRCWMHLRASHKDTGHLNHLYKSSSS